MYFPIVVAAIVLSAALSETIPATTRVEQAVAGAKRQLDGGEAIEFSINYLGCYADGYDGMDSVYTDLTELALLIHGTTSMYTEMVPEACALLCLGHKFYALHNGDECWCASTGSKSSITANGQVDGECETPCAGYTDDTCGGSSAFDLYENTDLKHLGCFNDVSFDDDTLTSYAMDTKAGVTDTLYTWYCYSTCLARGDYSYVATKDGNECWCGEGDDAHHERYGSSEDCNVPCSGDSQVSCGGYESFDLYRIE
ncbi:unnamed protein product [Pylaiella littoralis]